MTDKFDGYANLSAILEKMAKAADMATIEKAQAAGAEYFVGVMRSRGSPRGRSRPGMLDTIASQWDGKGNTVVGWMKFYGRLVESGHKTVLGRKKKPSIKARGSKSFVAARRHMKPEFDAQKNEITQRMLAVYQGGS